MVDSGGKESIPQPDKGADLIAVNPFIRYLNHALAGITETRQVALRIGRDGKNVEYEPTKSWIRYTTTALLLGLTVAAIRYRRKRLENVGGLVSLSGPSRPILAGAAWTTGIAGLLNARPIKHPQN
ncbi:hypothetical protein COEREDRAFT_82462 [Coemansia reversa NRRL 1564]|uniref:Uncharacterized protein n=1 Tax=Coemansia reversa (strain ATCC 12441 / NRRL 1564) TaxID=763665 RepID=A0A2G5B777_COERN|nr:hypothetical protein COEREDRAFT_82462 [Coemansia reversa NRRL 1564]|eukprot:PIA14859.1 hypothetical protein COEREDRAFT_82462 [Coemansia reversa NRRL 1564]